MEVADLEFLAASGALAENAGMLSIDAVNWSAGYGQITFTVALVVARVWLVPEQFA